jgi:site-specific DNA recombinase
MAELDKATRRSAKEVRCAIYTRKSTDEGLEQAFNSLDAQREACAAYIQSQRHEGWLALPTLYDDGGYSGGTLERPALRRLLADIETGQIDVVVVYKVDRLTRALSDFAKLVDIFDRRGVSFVSITQQFNTTTSMGRLTLNVLLSFAQFEREVIGVALHRVHGVQVYRKSGSLRVLRTSGLNRSGYNRIACGFSRNQL